MLWNMSSNATYISIISLMICFFQDVLLLVTNKSNSVVLQFCCKFVFNTFLKLCNGVFILEIIASREKCYKQIEAAIEKYREIKENINEGLKFYVTLQVLNIHLYFLPDLYVTVAIAER